MYSTNPPLKLKEVKNMEGTYLEYNRGILKKHGISLENHIMDPSAESSQIVVGEAKDNLKIFYRKFLGKDLYFDSRYAPEEDAVSFVEQFYRPNCKFIILIGLGFAYHAKALLHIMSQDQKIILIEPDKAIFCAALNNVDLYRILSDNRVYFHLYEEERNYREFIEGILENVEFLLDAESILTIMTPQYMQGYEMLVKMIMQVTNYSIIHQQTIRNTICKLSDRWLKNYLDNIPYFEESIPMEELFGKFSGIPAYLVSAGPSLNQNINELKKIGRNGIILAAYTALKVLLSNGIRPDFVVSIDGGQVNWEDSEQLNTILEIPLIYSPFVDTRLLKKHKGIKIRCVVSYDHYSQYINQKFSVDYKVIYAAGTVAATIMDAAYQMGCNPITFVGQDLAYTNDRTHAAGTKYDPFEEAIFAGKKNLFFIKNSFDEDVKTDSIFLQYKKGLEDYIHSHKNSRSFIDATEGGVTIEGSTLSALSEVVARYKDMACNLDVARMLEDIYEGNKSALKSYKDYVTADVKNSCSSLQQLSNILGRTVKKLKTMDTELALERIHSCNQKIDSFLKKEEFFQLPILGKIYEIENEFHGFEDSEPNHRKESILRSVSFYEKIILLSEKFTGSAF